MLRQSFFAAISMLSTIGPTHAEEIALYPYCLKSGPLVENLDSKDGKAPILKGSCGYIDLNGNWKIEPQFMEAYPFPEGGGLARVTVNSGYQGYIDTTGRAVVEAKFVGAKDFENGLASVKLDWSSQSAGLIDGQGNWIIPADYEAVLVLKNGLFLAFSRGYVYDGGYIFDQRGQQITDTYYYDLKAMREGPMWVNDGEGKPYRLLDRSGKLLAETRFTELGQIGEGITPVKTKDGWGYVDQAGKVIVEPQFFSAAAFSEGWAGVTLFEDKDFGSPGVTKFVNKTGEFLNAEVDGSDSFNPADGFHEGLAIIGVEGQGFGFMGVDGKIAIEPRFSSGSSSNFDDSMEQPTFRHGLAFIEGQADVPGVSQDVISRSLKGIIDRTGAWRVGPFLDVDKAEIVSGDLVKIAFYSIDGPSYRYFKADGTELVPRGAAPRKAIPGEPQPAGKAAN